MSGAPGTAGGAASAAAHPRRVSTPSGELQGVERDGVAAYLGVPYAKPPVGSLRWRPPQPLPRWRGVRLADHFGNDCMQRRRPGGHGRPVSEDCLYLNIWTPAHSPSARLPVMVWIHGGGFVLGAASQPIYDGANLARRGVVVVTLNYRLGLFGFFAHPALLEESPAGPVGNYGLLDQIAALGWVRRNIAAFGGDPADVTFFGQSAGGISVADLLTSPLARGLFQRAIIESGVMAQPATPLARAEASAEADAKSWGLARPTAAALRALPASVVLGSGPPLAVRAGPMIDGHVLPEGAKAAFRSGHLIKVPLLIGSVSYEAGFFPQMARGLAQRLAPEWSRVTKLYDGYGTHRTPLIEGELATDMQITAPTWQAAREAARAGLPVYLYYFAYLRPSEQGRVPGPIHEDEVYAVFGNMSLVEKHPDAGTRRIVEQMQSRWIRFARTGRPAAEPSAWPQVEPGALSVLEFTNGRPVVRGDFAGKRLALAARLSRIAFAPPPHG
ncbi:MAG: carboxylesterase/lipase family protein, partial [Steroidobacteraceae bacterium]